MRSIGCIWNDLNDKNLIFWLNAQKKDLIAAGKFLNIEIIIFFIINLTFG